VAVRVASCVPGREGRQLCGWLGKAEAHLREQSSTCSCMPVHLTDSYLPHTYKQEATWDQKIS